MEPYRDLTIAQQASKCLTLFEMLLESYGEQELSKHDVPRDAMRDAQARFSAWIEGIGALQRREASLAHPLRDPEIRLAVLELLKQLCIDLYHCARAQLKWTSSNDVASLGFPNVEWSGDENDGDISPQLAELLVGRKADTGKAKIYHEMGVGTIQSPQARATSTKDNASSRGKREDGIETGGLSPLHRAALQGDVESIEAALQEGADIEESSPNGAAPLTLATSKGHYDAIKKLLASGANVNAASTKGLTALMISVRKQDARTVKQLVCNGADMNLLSPDGWTALTEASSEGQQEIISILLKCGANTESRSAHDRTALMHASYNGDDAAVRLLLKAGSNTEATSAHGETAISLAAGSGHTDIVRKLLMYGCAPEPVWAKDQKDSSKEFSQKAMAKKIGEPEDSLHARGYTPLMFASQGGHVEIGRMLLERNINTEARSPHGKTALDIAEENERIDMISLLEFARHNTSTTS